MEKTRFRLPGLWKLVLAVIAGLLLVFFAGITWLGYHWKPVLASKLRKAVTESSDGLYRIDFKDLRVNLLTGYVAVEQPVLSVDSLVYRRLDAAGRLPGRVWTVSVNRLILKNTHPLKAWLHKEIEIGSIIIDQPAISMETNPKKDTSKIPDTRTLYQRIAKSLRSINVGTVFLSGAGFTLTDKRNDQPAVTVLKDLSARITDIRIDSASQYDQKRFYTARDLFVTIKDYSFATPDSLYNITLDEISASTGEGYARLKNLRVKPRYPEMAFSYKYKFQHDRYDLSFPDILLSKVDFNDYDNNDRLVASGLLIDKAVIRVFLNRSLPPPPIDKWVNFPHVILRRLKIKTRIDTFHIQNARVVYKEFNPLSGKSGAVSFTSFDARATNVTNDPPSLAKNNHSHAVLSALLQGKTPVNLSINFNLTDPAGAFSYTGHTGYLDLTSLNVLNRPMSLIEVKSGTVKRADFNISADRYGARGTLKLWYKDLKISILKKDGEEIKKKGVLSLLANSILVKNDNPAKNEPLRVGEIKFERPHWSSFFNLLWKGVFTGIKESTGLGVVKDKTTQPSEDGRMQKQLEKDKKKKEREARREERKKEREN